MIKRKIRSFMWLIRKTIIVCLYEANLLKYPLALRVTHYLIKNRYNHYFLLNILNSYANEKLLITQKQDFYRKISSIFPGSSSRFPSFISSGFLNFAYTSQLNDENIKFISGSIGEPNKLQQLHCKVTSISDIKATDILEIEEIQHLHSHSLSSVPNISKEKRIKLKARELEEIWVARPYLIKQEKNTHIVIQTADHFDLMDPYSCGYNIGNCNRHYDKNISIFTKPLGKNALCVDRAILFSEKADTNYFHWIFESLCQVKMMDNIPNAKDIPILISSNMPYQHYELLRLTLTDFGQRKFIVVDSLSPVYVKKLIVFDTPSRFADNIEKPDVDRVLVAEKSLKYFINKIQTTIKNSPLLDAHDKSNKKIFLDRGPGATRNIVNRKAVIHFLKKEGFKIVRADLLPVGKQIAIFKKADVIVAATGAALANVIFCKPYTQIVILTPEFVKGDCIFYTISEILKLKCQYIGCKSYANSFRKLLRLDSYGATSKISPFYVNTADLRAALHEDKELPLAILAP